MSNVLVIFPSFCASKVVSLRLPDPALLRARGEHYARPTPDTAGPRFSTKAVRNKKGLMNWITMIIFKRTNPTGQQALRSLLS